MNVVNSCNEEIYGVSISYSLNGESIGSRHLENADRSPLKSGDKVSYRFTSKDFPDGTSAIQLHNFSFSLSVIDRDGNETVVCEDMRAPFSYAWTFFYTLTGNYTKGFELNAS